MAFSLWPMLLSGNPCKSSRPMVCLLCTSFKCFLILLTLKKSKTLTDIWRDFS